MTHYTAEDRNSILLDNLGKLELKDEVLVYNTTEINHVNFKEDEYKEIYPNLTLTPEQAINRSLQYNILRKIQVKRKSLFKNAMSQIDTWSSINDIISTDYGKDSCIYFKLSRWLTVYIVLITLACIFFLVIPMVIMTDANDSPNYIALLLTTNQNWLANTPLFYGYYNQTHTAAGATIYSISRAYFWVNILTRILFIVVIIRKFIFGVSVVYTERYYSSVMESAIGTRFILGMWDFRALSKRSVVFCKVNIKDFIKKIYSSKTISKKATTSLNVLINVFCIGIIGVILERVTWLISEDERFFQTSRSDPISIWTYLRSPMAVSVLIISSTWFFDLIKCIEDYGNDHIKILTSTGRILLLNCGISIILILHWTTMIACTRTLSAISNGSLCHILRDEISVSPDSLLYSCWETWLGQRIVVYLLVNMFLSFVFYAVVDTVKAILKYSNISLIKPKFFYTAFIGNLCYMDCLFWLGYYYSPMLSLIWLLMVVLLFFYNINVISVSCFPRTSSSQSVSFQKAIFIFMLLISSLIGISTLIGHSLLYRPSRLCGPFVHLDYNFSPEDFDTSKNFLDNNFIKKVFDIGEQLLLSDGVWYSAIIVLLSLAFKFTFQVKALRKIFRLALGDKRMIEKDNRHASENCQGIMGRLRVKGTTYKPQVNTTGDNYLDEEYEKFTI